MDWLLWVTTSFLTEYVHQLVCHETKLQVLFIPQDVFLNNISSKSWNLIGKCVQFQSIIFPFFLFDRFEK